MAHHIERCAALCMHLICTIFMCMRFITVKMPMYEAQLRMQEIVAACLTLLLWLQLELVVTLPILY